MLTTSSSDKTYNGTKVTWIVFISLIMFAAWSSYFQLEQFVRAHSTVFSKIRTQEIQAVDGGVLEEIYVKEGDLVHVGQLLAKINSKRFEASSNEIKARVNALRAKITRLKAEIKDTVPQFDNNLILNAPEIVDIERTLYFSRKQSLQNDVIALRQNLSIAKSEQEIVLSLKRTGDVDQMEVLNARKAVIDADSKLKARINEYLEKASSELADERDQLSQSLQILRQRTDLVEDSDVIAQVPGYVKNIDVNTLGAVLQTGQKLMEIVPTEDVLLLEAKVTPRDIADIKVGQTATLRLDPFDASIYGTVNASVVFISADTVMDEQPKQNNEQPSYIVHLAVTSNEVITSVGKSITLIPGMTGQVDIKTGKRSVLTYLLKPIVKTLNQSFGEK